MEGVTNPLALSLHCVLYFRVADPQHFNADPHPAFHINADPDPASHQSDKNLRPLVYRPSKVPFWASRPPLGASTALHGSI
jgi:hypothetical protein